MTGNNGTGVVYRVCQFDELTREEKHGHFEEKVPYRLSAPPTKRPLLFTTPDSNSSAGSRAACQAIAANSAFIATSAPTLILRKQMKRMGPGKSLSTPVGTTTKEETTHTFIIASRRRRKGWTVSPQNTERAHRCGRDARGDSTTTSTINHDRLTNVLKCEMRSLMRSIVNDSYVWDDQKPDWFATMSDRYARNLCLPSNSFTTASAISPWRSYLGISRRSETGGCSAR